ncbi:hypothetical protein U6A24_03965 [Aquimarina gracilis]|uniref:Uncharacterized protein n=1 Tax=Aquimarina gracilis TaxID=874422 RepID=A0ABU5ZTB2_9FLAO|nr:hypothetical protein [Aquimarina gracilis]MEB3344602.1 hypothetical protein [Aquimarina gracilis]
MLEYFNCHVTIVNKTAFSLSLKSTPVNTHGDYKPKPPKIIPAGTTVKFSLIHTNWSPFGTDGSCQYQCNDGKTNPVLKFSYSCPSGNGLNATDVKILSGSGIQTLMIPNPLPQSGHPVHVQFTIS